MKTFLISIWLPFSILLISFVRFVQFNGFHRFEIVEFFDIYHILLLFIMAWPCGIPLTYALRKIYRHHRVIAYILTVLLIPVSGFFALTGGLFGPIGIALYSLVASLPAWIVLGIFALFESRRKKLSRQQV